MSQNLSTTALNVASKVKETLFLSDRGAIAISNIADSVGVGLMESLLIKIAEGRERDWGYSNPSQEMITQARELLDALHIEYSKG